MAVSTLFQIADVAAGANPDTSTVVISLPVIVFMLLAVLVVVLLMFGRASQRAAEAKKHLTRHEKDLRDGTINGKKPKKQKVQPAPQPTAPQGVTPEVVAAISAAVYMLEGEGAVVKSIRPLRKNPVSNRNPWAAAAVAENTKPFSF